MDDEFDVSVDTSSFDDIGSDCSDISSFDTSSDVETIMDEASFGVQDTPEKIEPDYESNIVSMMDEAAFETSDVELVENREVTELLNDVNGGDSSSSEYSQEPVEYETDTNVLDYDNSEIMAEEVSAPINDVTDESLETSDEGDGSAYDRLSEYYSSHNYGQGDYSEYSQDPEWQELNNAYLAEQGMELIDYSGNDDSITELGLQENVEGVVETAREYDDYEKSILEGKPNFYDTGAFYEQGINEFGYEGTCGPTSQANALNQLFDTNDYTENKILKIAVDNNLCSMDSSPENCGGTTTEQFMELYDKINEQLDGKISTQLFEYDDALDVNDVASKLDEGCVINVAVDASALWDQPRDYVNSMGIPCDDFYSDHWITVTGVHRDECGNVQGFNIIDSGGGVDYVSADKYHEMCFGTDEHRVIDPTCIVVSKNDVLPTSEKDLEIDINDSNLSHNEGNWFQRIFGRRDK